MESNKRTEVEDLKERLFNLNNLLVRRNEMEDNKDAEIADLRQRLFNLTREYETICNSYEQMCEIHRQEMARMQLIVDHHKEVVQDIILTLAHGKVE